MATTIKSVSDLMVKLKRKLLAQIAKLKLNAMHSFVRFLLVCFILTTFLLYHYHRLIVESQPNQWLRKVKLWFIKVIYIC